MQDYEKRRIEVLTKFNKNEEELELVQHHIAERTRKVNDFRLHNDVLPEDNVDYATLKLLRERERSLKEGQARLVIRMQGVRFDEREYLHGQT
jgi:hypothetical protein